MQSLFDVGISRQNVLYLNFFDDRLHELQRAGLGLILEAYYSLYPEKKCKEKVYFFLDEIQVCESITDPATRKREVAALEEAMGELSVRSGIIVTRSVSEKIEVASCFIEVVPVWRFLLSLPDMTS